MSVRRTVVVWLLTAAVAGAGWDARAQGVDALLSGTRRIVRGYAEAIDPAFTRTTSMAAAGPLAELPCHVFAHPGLRLLLEIGWARSPSFRQQCRRLAQAGAVVLMQQVGPALTPWDAESRISRLPDGRVMARVRVRDGRESVAVLAHELEHVLERIDGVNLASDALRKGSGTTLVGGAYETQRATRAGQQVADEIGRVAKRARRAAADRPDVRSARNARSTRNE